MSADSRMGVVFVLIGLALIPATCGLQKSQEADQASAALSGSALDDLSAGDAVTLSGRIEAEDVGAGGALYGCRQELRKDDDVDGNLDETWHTDSYLESRELILVVGTDVVDLSMPEGCANPLSPPSHGVSRGLFYDAGEQISVTGTVIRVASSEGPLRVEVDEHHAGGAQDLAEEIESEAWVYYIWAGAFAGLGLCIALMGRGATRRSGSGSGSGSGAEHRTEFSHMKVSTSPRGWSCVIPQSYAVQGKPLSCWSHIVGVLLAPFVLFPMDMILSPLDLTASMQAKIAVGAVFLCMCAIGLSFLRRIYTSTEVTGLLTIRREGLVLEIEGLGGPMIRKYSGGLRPQEVHSMWELWRPEVLEDFTFELREEPGLDTVLCIEKRSSLLLETRDRIDSWFAFFDLRDDELESLRSLLDEFLTDARARVGEGPEEVPDELRDQMSRDTEEGADD